jgi:hypothetical protein
MDMRKGGLVDSSDSGSYSDLNRLNQLKVGDKNSDANMRKVAQEFESLFLGEMLKSMRSATEGMGKDNPMNTPAAKQYQEMYDQQLAVSMSREGGGIGLADVLLRRCRRTNRWRRVRLRPHPPPSRKPPKPQPCRRRLPPAPWRQWSVVASQWRASAVGVAFGACTEHSACAQQ